MSTFNGFYFPTKVILVDDNQSFLDNLSLKLSENYLIDTYSNPFEATEAIQMNIQNNLFMNPSNLMIKTDSDEDTSSLTMDFNKLRAFTENPNRNNTISVVIVDYSMPLLNGIDFCKSLSELPILKIMLTGHADFKFAVNAFNKGIIDKFLVKDSEYMLMEIIENIELCQKQFFKSYSDSLLTYLPATKNTLIHSNEYRDYFHQIVDEFQIVEYYLLNTNGGYLLTSKNGTRYYLSSFDNNQLEEYLDIAQNAKIDEAIIKKIQNKTHTPILIKDENYKIPASDWGCVLHPIKPKGSGYYCIISEQDHVMGSF